MSIRKTGSATGEVTGVERQMQAEHDAAMPPGLRKVVAEVQRENRERWSEQDERELADENDRSDRPGA